MIPIFVLWACVFLSMMLSQSVIAPAALAQWAEAEGFQIERQRPALFPGPFYYTMGPFRVVYYLVGRDRDFHPHEGWACVGRKWWFSYSVETCPVEICWKE
jgi:hypothetical protein